MATVAHAIHGVTASRAEVNQGNGPRERHTTLKTSMIFLAVLLPAVAYYAFTRARALPPSLRARAGVAFALPVVLGLAALALLNLHKFGLAHPFGYTNQPLGPLYVGLWGLLFSSGRSLFLFSPPLLLGVWCLTRPQERWRAERAFLVAAAAIMVLFYASFRCWPADSPARCTGCAIRCWVASRNNWVPRRPRHDPPGAKPTDR